MSLFAVDKLGLFRRYRWRWSSASACWRPLPIASVFTREKTSLRCGARLSIPACCICFSVLPAIIGMAARTMNPNLENSNYAFLFATSFLPAILGLVVLIAGLSATMSSASSDAIAAVAIMMRDVYTLVTGKCRRRIRR